MDGDVSNANAAVVHFFGAVSEFLSRQVQCFQIKPAHWKYREFDLSLG
jgi:hypothetical protein